MEYQFYSKKFFIYVLIKMFALANCENRPNIIFIVADDLGWNDIGFHNSDIISPNIDKLAKGGVQLNQSYVQYLCTPSRSTFMTGYYPFRTGLQHSNLETLIPAGLPAKFRILPSVMKSLNYSTHIVGKWHLGYCNWNYTPTYRGFDSFFGYYTGQETYYTHEDDGYLDFRNNTDAVYNMSESYSLDLFANRAVEIIKSQENQSVPLFLYLAFQSVHAPLQVPENYIEMYKHIKDENRRNFSAMVTAMDDGIGRVVKALKSTNILNNTVIIFTSDNGGQILYGGNNYPLRGNKGTLWEGGTRGPAFVHSTLLEKKGYISNELMHSVDWFPTIIGLGGGKTMSDIDGLNQWDMISKGLPSLRRKFVYNIDNFHNSINAAIRVGDYKLIIGNPGSPDGWYPPKHYPKHLFKNITDKENVYLFNLKDDPTEHVNLDKMFPSKVKLLKNILQDYIKQAVQPFRPPLDPKGSPKFWGGIYTPSWCSIV